jgi:carbamate kinase
VTRQRLAVIAVGGNALLTERGRESIPDQYAAAYQTARRVVPLVREGWRVIVTHGNGPQVGFVLRRSELARGEVPVVPMDYAGADIQGAVGYMFVQALENALVEYGISGCAAAVVTRVEVAADDPAFANPTKPIGTYMSEKQARELAELEHWIVREDAGRGWRRVVPSPTPVRIRDLDTISALAEKVALVVACGGGGIPVFVGPDGSCTGAEAVIDKDLASSLLARELGADMFIVSTAVPRVAINFGMSDQEWLDTVTLKEILVREAEGHFLAGSMGPKVRAVAEFVAESGHPGVITDIEHLAEAIAGDAGTRIVPW